jgi:cyanate permease
MHWLNHRFREQARFLISGESVTCNFSIASATFSFAPSSHPWPDSPLFFQGRPMETVQTKPITAAWLMISVVLVALNLRPSMAAVGPLLSSIRGDVPLSFSSAALLTMLPVMAMGLAMFFGMGLAKRFGEHRSIGVSLVVIGVATLSRLFLDSALELIVSAVAAGVGIAMQ